ncbi:MAG: hypothetical protein VW683_00305 [Betaproteobacteria bacterium]|jgi:hypothetical protein
MPRKKSKKNVYWTGETEKYIILFNETEDQWERDTIFKDHLNNPINKLAENIINRFKFPYMDGSFENVKAEVVSYLTLNLHKFTPDKGKSFSYFSVIAKNYLILHNTKSYKRDKKSVYFGDANDDGFDLEELLTTEMIFNPEDEMYRDEMKEFSEMFIKYWEHNMHNVFKKDREIKICHAILHLLRRSEHIANFNKKALYVMLRDITGEKTTNITKVVKKMKERVKYQLDSFKNNGDFNDSSMYFIP